MFWKERWDCLLTTSDVLKRDFTAYTPGPQNTEWLFDQFTAQNYKDVST